MMTEQEQKRRRYLSDFIKSKNGSAAVANETGLNKQTLWQIQGERNGARDETVDALAAFYPDFDRERGRKYGSVYAATNEPDPKLKSEPPNDKPLEVENELLKKRVQELEEINRRLIADNDKLNAKVDDLEGVNKVYIDDIREIAKSNFPEPDNQTTDFLRIASKPEPIGYVLQYMMIQLSEKQKEVASTALGGMELYCQSVLSQVTAGVAVD